MLKLELFCSTGGIPGEEFAVSDSPSATERSSYFRIRGPETQRPILLPSPPRFPRVHESEGGRERNGLPYLIFTPSFITPSPFTSPAALSLGQHQNVCAAAASIFTSTSNSEAEVKAKGPIHILARILAWQWNIGFGL